MINVVENTDSKKYAVVCIHQVLVNVPSTTPGEFNIYLNGSTKLCIMSLNVCGCEALSGDVFQIKHYLFI